MQFTDFFSKKLTFESIGWSDEEFIKIMATFPSNYTTGDDNDPNIVIHDGRYVLNLTLTFKDYYQLKYEVSYLSWSMKARKT